MEQQPTTTTYRVTLTFAKGSQYTHTGVTQVCEKSHNRIEIILKSGERYRYSHVVSCQADVEH